MVYIFLANGFEEIEALYTVDVLRRAGVDIKTVGVGAKTITGSHKITIVCDTTTDEIEPSDELEMIILPGGLPGSTNLDEDACVDKFSLGHTRMINSFVQSALLRLFWASVAF